MKPYSATILLLCAFFLCLTNRAMAQQGTDTAYSLQQCIDLAIKNNLDVRQSEITLQAARITWQQAKENLLPTVSANLSHSFNQGRSIDPFTNIFIDQKLNAGNYGLNGQLVLFNGLALQQAIRRDALAYHAGEMDYQQAKDNITLSVIQAYLAVLNAEDQLNQTKQQAEVSSKQVSRLKIMHADGAVRPSEYYDLQGQFGDDRLIVVDAQNTLNASILSLVQFMNVPFNRGVRFIRNIDDKELKLYTTNPDGIYQSALKRFAQVKAAELRTQSARKAVQYFRGLYFPSLSLGGGLGTTYSSLATDQATQQRLAFASQIKNNYTTFVNFGLSIPIFNNFFTRNQVKRAKLDLENASVVESTTKIQLRQNIEQAYVNMTAAYDRLNVLQDQVNAYAESFRTAEVRFNAGEMNSVDFLVAKRNLDRSNINLINSRYNCLTTVRVLDYYFGRLSVN